MMIPIPMINESNSSSRYSFHLHSAPTVVSWSVVLIY